MLDRMAFPLLAIVVLLAAAGARAEPVVTIRTKEYAVSGRTGAEIMREINRKGPRHGFLIRAIAQTQYALDYRYEAVRANGRCRVSSAFVGLEITYVFPALANAVAPGLELRWRRFLRDVRAHEEAHGAIAIRMAREAGKAILAAEAPAAKGCESLKRRIEGAVRRNFERHEAVQRRFDRVEHRKGGSVDRVVEALVE